MKSMTLAAALLAASVAFVSRPAQARNARPSPAVEGGSDRPDITPDYTLGKEDVLDLSVVNFDQLDGPVTVRPDGKISVKLIGDIQAEGRTVADVRNEIAEKMKSYLPDPHVDLAVKAINSMKVFVLGRVTAPGEFSVGSSVNLLQALAMAKGFTPWARKSKLVLVRGSSGKRVHVDYSRVVDGSQDNYVLYPGDTIVVP